jgi:putative membrane protein
MSLVRPIWTTPDLPATTDALGRLDGISVNPWLVLAMVVVLGTVVAMLEPVIAVVLGWGWRRRRARSSSRCPSRRPPRACVGRCNNALMERFISTWFVSAVALSVAAWLLGEHMDIGTSGDEALSRIVTVLVVALVFTFVNSLIGPIIKVLSLPFIILTLGLALLIINALLLLLTERITDAFDVVFHIDGFMWAVLASIVISVSQAIVNAFVGKRG